MDILKMEKFSEDAFRVKRTYIDLTGDFISGVLLGQIVYWHLPNKQGKSRLRVQKEGRHWLAKGRSEWWEEIRISEKQFDRALKRLKDLSLVEAKLFKFNNIPMMHISLNYSVLNERVNAVLTKGKNPRDLPKGENAFYPKGKPDFDQKGKPMVFDQREKSLTETTEITTEITNNKTVRKKSPISYTEEFESFWTCYPKKRDKKTAFKNWIKLINRKEKPVEPRVMIEGAKGYKQYVEKENTPDRFIKHPTTFLNAESFSDFLGGDTKDEKSNTRYDGYNFDQEIAPDF